jgi:hypothetical protein
MGDLITIYTFFDHYAEYVNFYCDLCGTTSATDLQNLHRELPSCNLCGSTVRIREIVHVLNSLNISKRGRVIGLSDHCLISEYMNKNEFNYLNTFFDSEPKLDVSNPNDFKNCASVLISSDILEHVMPPFEKALKGHFDILRRGGYLILTTPYFKNQAFVEKYPWMQSYSVGVDHVVTGIDAAGRKVMVENPVFHGGPGNTLEMRLFTPDTLTQSLTSVGFRDIRILEEDILSKGIMRSSTNMGTIIARKPTAFRFL